MSEQFQFAGEIFPRPIYLLPKGTHQRRLERVQRKCQYMTAPTPNNSGGFFYHESDFAPGLRWQWCDDIAVSIRHRGWFCDEHQDETIRGLVFRLPRGRGFLAAWSRGKGMASAVDCETIHTDELSAALSADSWAQNVAEQEREYQAREMEEAA